MNHIFNLGECLKIEKWFRCFWIKTNFFVMPSCNKYLPNSIKFIFNLLRASDFDIELILVLKCDFYFFILKGSVLHFSFR